MGFIRDFVTTVESVPEAAYFLSLAAFDSFSLLGLSAAS